MPVGRTTTSSEMRALALVVGSLVLIAGAVVFFLTVIAHNGKVQVRLGDDKFNAGRAAEMAKAIAKNGPLKYADASGRQRDIVVNHLQDDPLVGWVAFEIRRPGDPRDCQVNWERDRGEFSYSCDPTVTFPADGGGLQAVPISVVSGDLIVDLNAQARASTSTSSSVVISGR